MCYNKYEITEDENKIIVIDLYAPFKNQVIEPTDEFYSRQKQIKNAILDPTYVFDDVTQEEKNTIEIKRNILNNILYQQSKSVKEVPFM